MTREEAIRQIENRWSIMDYGESEALGEALDMAIEALQAEYEDYEHATLVDIKEPLKVSVVRCKDCKYRCKEPIYSNSDPQWIIYSVGDCEVNCKTVCDDDFCSRGERREPENG